MSDCTTLPSGQSCKVSTNPQRCSIWDITQQSKTNCLADSYIQETLNIAGAQINVYKLMGVHEQTLLVDLTGNGTAISGGDAQNYPVSNAFTTLRSEWRSKQAGSQVVASGYIGYDFGVLKLPNGRQQYGVDASIRHEITTIKIKQSNNPNFRITKARIERSDDGIQWYGVSIVTLPNNNELNTIYFKNSAPNRYWRLRPLEFTGSECDNWGVQALEMHNYAYTHLSNIQDKILLENRDRDYSLGPIQLKGYYDLIDINTDLTRFGIEIPTANYRIKLNFTSCVAILGRPVVIGDIIELPSEQQYTPDLLPIKRYLEVSDVSWDSSSYTPGWMPTMLLITTQPALASEETQDIFGDLSKHVDSSGLFDNDDGNNSNWQDLSNIDQTIANESRALVSERGSEGSNVVRQFEPEELEQASSEGFKNLNKLGLNPQGFQVEDAVPPNGLPFSEGPEFPTNPSDKEYHRLTYIGLAKDVPARLYRWSGVKNRWVFMEQDKRSLTNNQKPILEEYITSSNKTAARDIG